MRGVGDGGTHADHVAIRHRRSGRGELLVLPAGALRIGLLAEEHRRDAGSTIDATIAAVPLGHEAVPSLAPVLAKVACQPGTIAGPVVTVETIATCQRL